MSSTKGVVAFLVICFGVAWLGIAAAAMLGLSLVNPLVQLGTAAFTPAVAAIIVRRWITREGFADAGLRPRLRSAWSSYLLAWLGPPVVAAAAIGLAAVVGRSRPDLSPLALVPGLPAWVSVGLLVLVAVPVLTPLYWGEEFGWTGYLRTRLFSGRAAPSILGTGVAWAVWHFPLAFVGYIHFADLALGLLVWTGYFLLWETVLTWLWLRSGSIWPPSVAHCGNNMVISLLVGTVLAGRPGFDDLALTALMAVPMIPICAWLLVRGRLAVRAPRTPVNSPVPSRRGLPPTVDPAYRGRG